MTTRDQLPAKGQGYLRKLAYGHDRLDQRILMRIAGVIEDLLIENAKLKRQLKEKNEKV